MTSNWGRVTAEPRALESDARPARILILGLNYAPEQVGIGPYSTGLAQSLKAAGHTVEVIAAHPYYPAWKRAASDGRFRYSRTLEAGIAVTRCPLYVPQVPNGLRRILHHLSFAASVVVPLIKVARSRNRPDLVAVIAPSMVSAPVGRFFARLMGARLWLHIQDFEVGAAFATGLIRSKSPMGRLATAYQQFAYAGFDLYSTISPQMCERLAVLGIQKSKIYEFRNWSDSDTVEYLNSNESIYRRQWNITTPHIALYSGNISRKQGIDIVVGAARALQHRTDLTFVICGNGPSKQALVASGADLKNLLFVDLQPRESLHELLGLATIHLLPQIEGAADLVLPSKLTNILASGKPVVTTAALATGLAQEVEGCGILVSPGDRGGFAKAIVTLADNPEQYQGYAVQTRLRAIERWSKEVILGRLNHHLLNFLPKAKLRLVAENPPRAQISDVEFPEPVRIAVSS